MLHVIMHTDKIHEQQELLGHLGVNLLFGVYEYQNDPELFIQSLKDNIDSNLLEINFIEVKGEAVARSTSITLSLLLVKYDLTKMVMIGVDGEILQPLNALYKKDAVIVRGRFNPPTNVTVEMFDSAKLQLIEKHAKRKQDILQVAEITFKCYQDKKELELTDFLNRTELLAGLGYPVLITNFEYHHDFINFMNNFFQLNSLNLVLGLDNLERSIQSVLIGKSEKYFLNLIDALVSGNNRILAFPEADSLGNLKGMNTLHLDPGTKALLSFLKTTGRIEDLNLVDGALLKIRSNAVLDLLKSGNRDWHHMVPKSIHPILHALQSSMNKSYSTR